MKERGAVCRLNRGHWLQGAAAGFTLLEVMIAVAIIAIAFVSLLGSQSQSVAIATEARFRTEAAMLASRKLRKIAITEPADLVSEEGDFDEPFSRYHWRIEVNDLDEEESGIQGLTLGLKRVELQINLLDNEVLVYRLATIVMDRVE